MVAGDRTQSEVRVSPTEAVALVKGIIQIITVFEWSVVDVEVLDDRRVESV